MINSWMQYFENKVTSHASFGLSADPTLTVTGQQTLSPRSMLFAVYSLIMTLCCCSKTIQKIDDWMLYPAASSTEFY